MPSPCSTLDSEQDQLATSKMEVDRLLQSKSIVLINLANREQDLQSGRLSIIWSQT